MRLRLSESVAESPQLARLRAGGRFAIFSLIMATVVALVSTKSAEAGDIKSTSRTDIGNACEQASFFSVRSLICNRLAQSPANTDYSRLEILLPRIGPDLFADFLAAADQFVAEKGYTHALSVRVNALINLDAFLKFLDQNPRQDILALAQDFQLKFGRDDFLNPDGSLNLAAVIGLFAESDPAEFAALIDPATQIVAQASVNPQP